MQSENKKILIIRPGGIGDLVLTIPVLVALRKKYIHSRFTILSNFPSSGQSSPIELLFFLGLVDESVNIDFTRGKLRSFFNYFSKINLLKNKFDISICLRHSSRGLVAKIIDYFLFKRLLNIKISFGLWNSSDLSFAYDGSKMIPMINEGDRMLNILKSEGVNLPAPNFVDYVSDRIKGYDLSHEIPLEKKYVIFCPFGKPFKKTINKVTYHQTFMT